MQYPSDRASSLGILRLRNTSSRSPGQLLRPVGTAKAPATSHPRGRHTGQPSLRVPAAPAAPPIHTVRIRPSITASLKIAHARQRAWHEEEPRSPTGAADHIPTNSTRTSATPGPSQTPSPPELMEDDEEARKEAEADANGKDPTPRCRKQKPAARNIHGNHRHILTIAKQHMLAYSIVEGPYQSRGLVKRWVPAIWTLTWEQELPDIPAEPPSAETSEVIVNGLPTGRCKIKDALRPLTQYEYGFIKPANTPEAVNHNIKVFRSIHPNNFHCLQYEPVYGHYEGKIVSQAIAVALFSGPSSVGVTFRDYFDPMPLTAVAFVLANLQFCIEEYETGHYQARDLSAANMLNKYVAHLRGLKAARLAAKSRMSRLAQDWFTFGFDYSGAMELDDPFTQVVTLREDVRPDTPSDNENEPEPEPEPEVSKPELDENGRYTSGAKGKGRA
ncbi:hypothetical protein FRC12_020197 [Ceratobasidium sp. 428]|nr:hypothetical protein FRC12_020197 [Ceratobasidium sp. 428]